MKVLHISFAVAALVGYFASTISVSVLSFALGSVSQPWSVARCGGIPKAWAVNTARFVFFVEAQSTRKIGARDVQIRNLLLI